VGQSPTKKVNQGTIVNPCGGGGSSIALPGFASKLFEDILIELETQAKNLDKSDSDAVLIKSTLSVIRFSIRRKLAWHWRRKTTYSNFLDRAVAKGLRR